MKTPPTRRIVTALLSLATALLATVPAHAQLSVQWITQYGSAGNDTAYGIAVDALGQSWVGGSTRGNLGGTNAGIFDVFLSRLSPSGSVDFTRQRGSTGFEAGYGGVALVGSGSVFAGGDATSTAFDGQTPLGNEDGLLVRYDTSGTWQGTKRLGGPAYDSTRALAGNATNLLATGFTQSSFDGQTNAGFNDAFLSKRDSTGTVLWTRFVGTSSDDRGSAATFDSAGNGYLAGFTLGSLSGFSNAGASDIFVSRYDPAGNLTLLKQVGTSGSDGASAVKVDASGNIYLAGGTQGALGGESNAGGTDAFIMKLDSNGNLLWTRLIGGTGNDDSYALGLDATGHVWIGGSSTSTFGGHSNGGGYDAFIAEYDSTGLLLGTSFLTSSGDDEILGMALGPDGSAYVTGYTNGALGGPNAGSSDIFVAKITAAPEPSAALLLAGAGAGLLLRRRRA